VPYYYYGISISFVKHVFYLFMRYGRDYTFGTLWRGAPDICKETLTIWH